MTTFPPLDNLEPTRATLHKYAQAIGVLPRTHGRAHPQWWHISLRVTPGGLQTVPFDLPDGRQAWLALDLDHHLVAFETSAGDRRAFDMRDGRTGTEMGNALLAAAAELGLDGEYAREKFESDDPRPYDPAVARSYWGVLRDIERILREHRAGLPGRTGPIQIWPHGFDIAFEWFGTRVQRHEENGEVQALPSQLNLGFYPGGSPYFYSNPWPFEADQLLGKPLPAGAAWHTEGWQGTMLPYAELVGDPQGENRLRAYARAVFDLVKPTLMA